MASQNTIDALLYQIRKCKECQQHLEHDVRPVVAASTNSKLVIIGQAPGRIVHRTGIPWNDKSGDNLRTWLGLDKTTFYNVNNIALMPMGFCYPGTGKNGDLPPRPECAPLWHEKLLALMPHVKLTLLVGKYAHDYYLGKNAKNTLAETVRSYDEYMPKYFPLPHPSPRNKLWLSKNQWFEQQVVPHLIRYVKEVLQGTP